MEELAIMSGYVFLYCIGPRDGGVVKIGIAQEPKKRLSQLQTGHPSKLSLFWKKKFVSRRDAFSAEKFVHGELSNKRVGGEWFSVSDREALEIAELATSIRAKKAKAMETPSWSMSCRIHANDEGLRATTPESDSHWIKRARMSVEERRIFWKHCDLEDPPPGYDDWFVFGGKTPMGAWPIKFGPLPEDAQ